MKPKTILTAYLHSLFTSKSLNQIQIVILTQCVHSILIQLVLQMYQNDIKKRVDLIEIILTFTCCLNRTNSPR